MTETGIQNSGHDFRPLLEDILRLGMQGVPGYANRAVDQIQVEYITNPYGRQPPHILFFPDGRVERLTPFQLPVPGYGANVLAIELLGYIGQAPTEVQLEALRQFGTAIRETVPGRLGFTGNADLVETATRNGGAAPPFMDNEQLAMADIVPPPAPSELGNVQDLFDVLGTPDDRRTTLPPGSIFNSVTGSTGAQAVAMRTLFKAPGTRTIKGLVIVPSHDAFKAEPADASAFSLDALRKTDQRLGMTDFRGHYIIARDGSLVEGRDLEKVGNCWPGKNEGTIQLVLAGNGRSPTPEQRNTIYQYGVALRKHFEYPMQAYIRDVTYADQLLGVDANGTMIDKKANPALIEAPLAQVGKGQQRAI